MALGGSSFGPLSSGSSRTWPGDAAALATRKLGWRTFCRNFSIQITIVCLCLQHLHISGRFEMQDLDGLRCTSVGWISALSRRFTCLDYTGPGTRRNHHQAPNRDLCAVAEHDVCDLRIDVHAVNLSSDEQPFEEAH